MAWLALLGASRGRTALAAVAGIGLGLAVAGTAAALGLAALIRHEPPGCSMACAGPDRSICSISPGTPGVMHWHRTRNSTETASALFQPGSSQQHAQSQGLSVLCRDAAAVYRSGTAVARAARHAVGHLCRRCNRCSRGHRPAGRKFAHVLSPILACSSTIRRGSCRASSPQWPSGFSFNAV